MSDKLEVYELTYDDFVKSLTDDEVNSLMLLRNDIIKTPDKCYFFSSIKAYTTFSNLQSLFPNDFLDASFFALPAEQYAICLNRKAMYDLQRFLFDRQCFFMGLASDYESMYNCVTRRINESLGFNDNECLEVSAVELAFN